MAFDKMWYIVEYFIVNIFSFLVFQLKKGVNNMYTSLLNSI